MIITNYFLHHNIEHYQIHPAKHSNNSCFLRNLPDAPLNKCGEHIDMYLIDTIALRTLLSNCRFEIYNMHTRVQIKCRHCLKVGVTYSVRVVRVVKVVRKSSTETEPATQININKCI